MFSYKRQIERVSERERERERVRLYARLAIAILLVGVCSLLRGWGNWRRGIRIACYSFFVVLFVKNICYCCSMYALSECLSVCKTIDTCGMYVCACMFMS